MIVTTSLFTKLPLVKRQRRDVSVFESSCHLFTTHGRGFALSHLLLNSISREAVNTGMKFYCLWFDSTGNQTRVYRFCRRRSNHGYKKAKKERKKIKGLVNSRGHEQTISLSFMEFINKLFFLSVLSKDFDTSRPVDFNLFCWTGTPMKHLKARGTPFNLTKYYDIQCSLYLFPFLRPSCRSPKKVK